MKNLIKLKLENGEEINIYNIAPGALDYLYKNNSECYFCGDNAIGLIALYSPGISAAWSTSLYFLCTVCKYHHDEDENGLYRVTSLEQIEYLRNMIAIQDIIE